MCEEIFRLEEVHSSRFLACSLCLIVGYHVRLVHVQVSATLLIWHPFSQCTIDHHSYDARTLIDARKDNPSKGHSLG